MWRHASAVSALFVFSMFGLPASGEASPIPLGTVTFDTFIAGPGGTNAFFVSNLTGEPATGGFALPPDFPVVTSLEFTLPSLQWVSSAGGASYDFGNVAIGPGFLPSDPSIQFPDTLDFSTATFTALLNTNQFQLADGRLFDAVSLSIVATLTNPLGALAPGDTAVLTVEANEVPTSVPEPATLAMLATGLAYGLARKRRHA